MCLRDVSDTWEKKKMTGGVLDVTDRKGLQVCGYVASPVHAVLNVYQARCTQIAPVTLALC